MRGERKRRNHCQLLLCDRGLRGTPSRGSPKGGGSHIYIYNEGETFPGKLFSVLRDFCFHSIASLVLLHTSLSFLSLSIPLSPPLLPDGSRNAANVGGDHGHFPAFICLAVTMGLRPLLWRGLTCAPCNKSLRVYTALGLSLCFCFVMPTRTLH